MELTEQIIENINNIDAFMDNQDDLKSDVLPFLKGTFFKIKQLSTQKTTPDLHYELFKIASTYIPNTIHAYCSLPIDYRNKQILKDNKTSRDIMVSDLSLIKQQVKNLERDIFSDYEKAVKINSNIIKEKFDNQMQLATEIESDSRFINQFDIDTYAQNTDFHSSLFEKSVNHKEQIKHEKNNQRKEKTQKYFNQIKSSMHSCISAFINSGKALLNFVDNSEGFKILLGILGFVFVCFLAIFGAIKTFNYINQDDNFVSASITESAKIYSVMTSSHIGGNQLPQLASNAQKEWLDDSYKQSVGNITVDEKKVINLHLTGISQASCRNIIDNKEAQFTYVDMNINHISLPEHNSFSTYSYLTNNNHNLCYLTSNNTIDIKLNPDVIYDTNQGFINGDSRYVDPEITVIDRNIKELTEQKTLARRPDWYDQFIANLKIIRKKLVESEHKN